MDRHNPTAVTPEADPIAAAVRAEVTTELRADIARHKALLTYRHSHAVMDVVLNVGGCETELKAEVYFERTPAEPRAWDYPGDPAQAEILHVYVGDTDIGKLMSAEALNELSESLV